MMNSFNPRPSATVQPGSPPRETIIDMIGFIVIAGFALAVFYHYYRGVYSGLGYPYNTFLFRPEDHFNDFKDGLRVIDRSLPGPTWDPGMQSPLWQTYDVWPFLRLLHYPFLPFGLRWGMVLWLTLFTGMFLAWCVRHLQGATKLVTMRNAFVFSFLTYPFLVAVDRANPEMLVFIFLAAFYGWYATPRHYLGLVALAAAIAMKAFPGVYLVLLWCDRRWKDSILVGVLAVGLNLVSAAVLPGGFAPNINKWLFQSTADYQSNMAVGDAGLMFGSSLWGVMKVGLASLLPIIHRDVPHVLSRLQLPYLLGAFVLFGLLIAYMFFREKVTWKKVTLLAFAMILLPYVSADYRLLHVVFPLFMFINSEERGRFAKFYAVMFALLLIPKGYVHLPHVKEATIQIILNPLIMASMSLAIIWEGLRPQVGRQPESGSLSTTGCHLQ